MGGANWMGGRMNTAKARSKDTHTRLQKRHFARRALQLAPSSTQAFSGNKKILDDIDLAAARREKESDRRSSTTQTNEAPTTPPRRRDEFILRSSSSDKPTRKESEIVRTLDALETTVSRDVFLRRILNHADLVGTRRGLAGSRVDRTHHEQVQQLSSSPCPFPMDLKEVASARPSPDSPWNTPSYSTSGIPALSDPQTADHLVDARVSISSDDTRQTADHVQRSDLVIPRSSRYQAVRTPPIMSPAYGPPSPYQTSRNDLKDFLDKFSNEAASRPGKPFASSVTDVDGSELDHATIAESRPTYSSKRQLIENDHQYQQFTPNKRQRVQSVASMTLTAISPLSLSPQRPSSPSYSHQPSVSDNPWTALYLEIGLQPPAYVSRPPWCLPDEPEYWLPENAGLDRHLALECSAPSKTLPTRPWKSEESETRPLVSETVVEDDLELFARFSGMDSDVTNASLQSVRTMPSRQPIYCRGSISPDGSTQAEREDFYCARPVPQPQRQAEDRSMFSPSHPSADTFPPARPTKENEYCASSYFPCIQPISCASNNPLSHDILDEINVLLDQPSASGFAGDAYETAVSDLDLSEILEGFEASPVLIPASPSQQSVVDGWIPHADGGGRVEDIGFQTVPYQSRSTSGSYRSLGTGSIKSEVVNGRVVHLGPSLF